MSKQPPPAPTASTIGPCPTIIQISRTPGTGSLPSTFALPDHPLVRRSQVSDTGIWLIIHYISLLPLSYLEFCSGLCPAKGAFFSLRNRKFICQKTSYALKIKSISTGNFPFSETVDCIFVHLKCCSLKSAYMSCTLVQVF